MALSFPSSQDLEIQKSPLNFSPYEKFMYALNSKEHSFDRFHIDKFLPQKNMLLNQNGVLSIKVICYCLEY
jgi:hypothetical protein